MLSRVKKGILAAVAAGAAIIGVSARYIYSASALEPAKKAIVVSTGFPVIADSTVSHRCVFYYQGSALYVTHVIDSAGARYYSTPSRMSLDHQSLNLQMSSTHDNDSLYIAPIPSTHPYPDPNTHRLDTNNLNFFMDFSDHTLHLIGTDNIEYHNMDDGSTPPGILIGRRYYDFTLGNGADIVLSLQDSTLYVYSSNQPRILRGDFKIKNALREHKHPRPSGRNKKNHKG